jgi:branched-chain amino acid transport system ATP-binding protein
VFETLHALRDDGVTMLLVEQNAARAVEFAVRSYVMGTGRVVLHGRREELAVDGVLERAYFGARAP